MKTDRTTTALLVVDVQNDVMGAAWRSDEIIATIAGLVERARAAGMPVVWVRHHDAGMPEGSDAWQIVPALHPADGEPIVEKAWGDSFAETTLEDVFARLGVGAILLCGAMTNMCINATMYGALHRGYDVTLIEDAHTTEAAEFDDPRTGVVEFPADHIVVWQNMMAAYTRLPGVSCGVATAADAIQ